jgi:hypothetical protein
LHPEVAAELEQVRASPALPFPPSPFSESGEVIQKRCGTHLPHPQIVELLNAAEEEEDILENLARIQTVLGQSAAHIQV